MWSVLSHFCCAATLVSLRNMINLSVGCSKCMYEVCSGNSILCPFSFLNDACTFLKLDRPYDKERFLYHPIASRWCLNIFETWSFRLRFRQASCVNLVQRVQNNRFQTCFDTKIFWLRIEAVRLHIWYSNNSGCTITWYHPRLDTTQLELHTDFEFSRQHASGRIRLFSQKYISFWIFWLFCSVSRDDRHPAKEGMWGRNLWTLHSCLSFVISVMVH